MRRRIATAALLTLVAICAGCGGGAPKAGGSSTAGGSSGAGGGAGGAAPAPPSPALARACADAHQVINRATATFTAQVQQAVNGQDSGDVRAETAALARIRSTFTHWSTALATLAGTAADPRLAAVLTEYAGAITATIARIRTPADLEQLVSFDDRELDMVADKFAAVCP